MDEQEQKEKAAFAALLIRMPTEPFPAALQVIPNDTGRALKASFEWPHDEFVIAEMKRLKEQSADIDLLPNKAELCQKIWDKLNGTGYMTPEDFVKTAKLYAEVRGFIEKPSNAVTVQNNFVQKVIEVANHGSDDQWEAAAAKQQQELLNVARTRH